MQEIDYLPARTVPLTTATSYDPDGNMMAHTMYSGLTSTTSYTSASSGTVARGFVVKTRANSVY
jgi:YD repeat-containing protein